MGTILHFDMQELDDYYILNPQWWFNGCALVLSPDNVSDLVMSGNSKTYLTHDVILLIIHFSIKLWSPDHGHDG